MTYIAPRQKIYQHLDRLADIKAGRRPPPVNVEIDLSNRCSLGCKGCHFAHTHTRGPWTKTAEKPDGFVPGGDLMDKDLATSIIEQLSRYSVRSIVWSGGGEPTLHPRFNSIVALSKQGYDMDQGVYTHGGHIDIPRARVLKVNMKWVYVSLDRHTRQSFIDYKGVDYFDQTCAGIRHLVETPRGRATIGVGFLLDSKTWVDAPAMYELGMSLGVDYVQFRPTVYYDHSDPGRLTEDAAWITNAVKVLKGLQDMPGVEVDLTRFEMYQNWTGHPYQTCYWSGLATVITPNGKVWTCCNTREQPAHELGD